MERDVFDVISAASGVATVATLIYLVVKDYRTRKQVQDLTGLILELQEQNRLLNKQMKVDNRPVWVIKFPEKNIGRIIMDIHNQGAMARIMSVQDSEGRITQQPHPGIEVQNGGVFRIQLNVGLTETLPDGYAFWFTYKDVFNNPYQATIKHKGNRFYINNTEVVIGEMSAVAT